MARKKNTSMYMAALTLFLGGMGYLLYSGFSENSVYFLNVGEALAAPQEKLKAARLFGTVSEQDMALATQGPGVTFRLMDPEHQGKTMMIAYKGAVPDTFKPGAEVIVEGGMGQNGVFTAKTLMTKCPSKYEKENRQQG